MKGDFHEEWLICPECGENTENRGRYPELYEPGAHNWDCPKCGASVLVVTRIKFCFHAHA